MTTPFNERKKSAWGALFAAVAVSLCAGCTTLSKNAAPADNKQFVFADQCAVYDQKHHSTSIVPGCIDGKRQAIENEAKNRALALNLNTLATTAADTCTNSIANPALARTCNVGVLNLGSEIAAYEKAYPQALALVPNASTLKASSDYLRSQTTEGKTCTYNGQSTINDQKAWDCVTVSPVQSEAAITSTTLAPAVGSVRTAHHALRANNNRPQKHDALPTIRDAAASTTSNVLAFSPLALLAPRLGPAFEAGRPLPKPQPERPFEPLAPGRRQPEVETETKTYSRSAVPTLDKVIATNQPDASTLSRSRKIINWAKKNAPAIMAGSATGAATRFGIAALATTLHGTAFASAVATAAAAAPVVAAVLSAVGIGAVAGGFAEVAKTAWLERGQEEKTKFWKSFGKGALVGGIFGGLTAGIVEAVASHSGLHNLTTSAHHATGQHATAAQPATNHSSAALKNATPHSAGAPAADTAAMLPTFGLNDIIKAEQLRHLSPDLQNAAKLLAQSHDPNKLLGFCKEASFYLHQHGHNHDAFKVVKQGLDLVKNSQAAGTINDTVLKQLNADYAYFKVWAVGTNADLCDAREHLSKAGKFGVKLADFIRNKMPASKLCPG